MPGRVIACSRLFRTPAWPPGAGPDFVNAAAVLSTSWSPGAVLDRLHRVEERHGRVRQRRWAPRVLDLDLLAAGQAIAPDVATFHRWMTLSADRQMVEAPETLVLPHPRLADRAFVLIPLLDVAPDWRHPVTGRTVRAMADALSAEKRREIRAIGTVDGVVNRKRGA
ncbi:2-amino-4-hydroxy-6-hydroxymethyldihydropteridinediphosphokinase [Jannaschia faecimaris]|uniref:2-amino-4-hydroxy-6-hydroxymethyldihydropteridine pyrophosphokinase n=2 Tax=Jannaschia faecimaris TaxID=1244108 RepID=A0A1H3TZW8_9RHOB|nr:2-amino-4-hydroxy-6-hydroxymethyldihydropteridinediphosphokinase [Jannaschia faecimaris]